MFARVVRYKVDPERCDEALEAFEEAAKAIGDIDGITGGYVMVDGDIDSVERLRIATGIANDAQPRAAAAEKTSG